MLVRTHNNYTSECSERFRPADLGNDSPQCNMLKSGKREKKGEILHIAVYVRIWKLALLINIKLALCFYLRAAPLGGPSKNFVHIPNLQLTCKNDRWLVAVHPSPYIQSEVAQC